MNWIMAVFFIAKIIYSNGLTVNQTIQPLVASNITMPAMAPPSPVASPPLVTDNSALPTSQVQSVVVPFVSALLPPAQSNAPAVTAVAQLPRALSQSVPSIPIPQAVPQPFPQNVPAAVLPSVPAVPVLQAAPVPVQSNVLPAVAIPAAVPPSVPAVPLLQAAPVPVQSNVLPQQNCVCGVFLSGQFVKGSSSQPIGNPALLHEQGDKFSCTPMGNKQCTNKCLDLLVKHLPNSPTIICGSLDRDCYKERAYLWIQNCNSPWINTNLSAGREYCCKEGVPYKCPFA